MSTQKTTSGNHEASNAPSMRDRVEAGFSDFGRVASRRAWVFVFFSLVMVLAFVSQFPTLRVDVSDTGFLHEEDPIRVAYDRYSRLFGGDTTMLLAVEPDEVFEVDFIERLRGLHEELEGLEQIESVTSLINARNTYGREDELVVEDLIEAEPGDPIDLALLRERIRGNPLYRNNLISKDERATTLVVKADRYSSAGASHDVLADFESEAELEFLSEDEQVRIASEVLEVVERHRAPDMAIHATGGPILEYWMSQKMQRDILVSIGSSAFFISLLLYVLFRRISGVVLPMILVGLALLCSIGAMAFAGVAITLPIQVLRSFLLAVGVCGAVHILVLFYRAIDDGVGREGAIAQAMGHSGLPVFMAGITTAGGLASFISSPLAPVAHFGIFGPLGVLFMLFFVLVSLPAVLAVTPIKPRSRRQDGDRAGLADRILLGMGRSAIRHPWRVVAGSGLLLLGSLVGTSKLSFTHHPIEWIPPGTGIHTATRFINERLGGASEISVLLETPGVEDGMQDPALLQSLDELRLKVLAMNVAGIQPANSSSLADIVKETHKALNENREAFYSVPSDPDLTAQELLLFQNSGSDDLEDFVDSRFSIANFSARIPWYDAMDTIPFIDAFEEIAMETLGPHAKVILTGNTVIFTRTFAGVIKSMATSYGLALVIITPLMILLIGNPRIGLLSMVPNIGPILLTLGMMGWAGYGLDFSTMMIGAIVLGVAVDDTIHFMHVFQRYHRQTGDVVQAVEATLSTTGRAILYTSIVLCVGFSGFTLATMSNLVTTGILTCFAIAAAFFADILLAPALVVLFLGREVAEPSGDRSSGSG